MIVGVLQDLSICSKRFWGHRKRLKGEVRLAQWTKDYHSQRTALPSMYHSRYTPTSRGLHQYMQGTIRANAMLFTILLKIQHMF